MLFEVLSPSTEAWDRGGKFQHRPHIEVFTRQEDGSWRYRSHGPGSSIPLGVLDLEVDPLYLDLPEEPDPGEET